MNTITKPVVHGPIDHNAFAVLGAASKALRKAGQGDRVKEMMDKSTNGDYNHLLAIVQEYVDFELEDDGYPKELDNGGLAKFDPLGVVEHGEEEEEEEEEEEDDDESEWEEDDEDDDYND